MSSVRVPSILDELARAGENGIAHGSDPRFLEDLELLQSRRFPVHWDVVRAWLQRDDDVMVPVWLEQEPMRLLWGKPTVVGFLETGSTNQEALRLAENGADQGLLVYSETQTAGRGRLGRHWFSPHGAGIYVSVLVEPQQARARWGILAHTAALAVVHAISEVTAAAGAALHARLKWPNDVLIRGKKVSGILIEAVPGRGTAVIGCGINVAAGSVPVGLGQQATALNLESPAPVPRRRLAVSLLNNLQSQLKVFQDGRCAEIVEAWKQCSDMWNNTAVWVLEGDRRRRAVTCGLNEDGTLRVRTDSGVTENLLAADVSIRNEALSE
jgi:BirA family transcriptional regulator, biotin operon repressor / biotin---[acetyl-CoA-carboxylase] ligase